MADKEIRLVGSFKDDITPKLKKLSTQLTLVTKQFEKLQSKLRPIARDMGVIAMASDRVSGSLKGQRTAFESSVRGMQAYKKELGGVVSAQKRLAKQVTMPTVRPPRGGSGGGGSGGGGGGRGGGGGLTGAAAAGTFLGGGALMAATGAANVIGGSVRSAFGFLGDRFREAMQDEISDIQAQGAIFGVLRKEGLVTDYKAGKQIAKTLDIEIAKMVASSPIPTATITTLNRTLSDTFLPGLMKGFKAEGQSTFDAARNSAKKLAGFYEQIGYLTPPNYPIGMVTKGITKLIEAGKITGEIMQIDFFQLNPQLIPELRRRNFEQAKTIMERMKILQEAMSVVMPPEAMAEIRTSLTAGTQGIQDNLTNVSVGLLSFGAEMKKAMDVSYVYRDLKTGKMVTAFKKVTTPLQLISAKLAPVLMELGNVLSQMSDKLGPITVHLAKAFSTFFGPALQVLTQDLAGIADAIQSGNLKDMGEIIGKVVGNVLKALSTGLEAIGDTKGPMGQFMQSFTKGLNSVFPKEAQARLAKRLENAFGTLISKTVELAAPPLAAALVKIITSFIEGLFNAGLVGKILLGAGALKLLGKGSIREGLSMAGGFLGPRMQGAARGMTGLQGPMPSGAAQQGLGIGARVRGSFAGTPMGRMGTRMSGAASRAMPGIMGFGQGIMARGGGLIKGAGKFMKGGGGAGALTAAFSAIDTFSQLGAIGDQQKQLKKEREAALRNNDMAALKDISLREKELAAKKGETVASGVGGAAGALAGGAIGAALGGPIGAMIGAQLGQVIGTKLGPAIGNFWNSTAWPALQSLGAMIGNFFSTVLPNWWSGTAWPAIQSAFNLLKTGIGQVFKFLFAPQIAVLNFIRSGISNIVPGVGKFFADLPARIGSALKGMFNWFGQGGPVGGGIGKFPKTSGFGMRWGRMHSGNDYGMPVGTKLGLGGPGRVLFSGNAGGYGKMMDIGGPGGMVYRFAHLSKFLAPMGANVPPGMAFALSGNTGRSTGPHLHFEARPGGGSAVNPDRFAGMIRAGYEGMGVGPLMQAAASEISKMPYGAQLAVRNTDEIFMKPRQMSSLVESATSAGVKGAGNVTMSGITINVNGTSGDARQIADQIAGELLAAMTTSSYTELYSS